MNNVIIVEPTNKVGEEGYFEAKVKIGIMEDNTFTEVYSWIVDSIHIKGNVNIDFEPNGNTCIWRRDNELWINASYGTTIWGGKDAKESDCRKYNIDITNCKYELLDYLIEKYSNNK